MDYTVILRNGRHAFLEAEGEYIIACGFNEKRTKGQQWDHGLYFIYWNADEETKTKIFYNALEAFRKETEINYIPRCRLEELVTQLKDGLIEFDKESAMKCLDEVCEITEDEKEWLEIETE